MSKENVPHKVDPGSIHTDQRKQDTRRDAWDRDYMGGHYVKTDPPTTKQVSKCCPSSCVCIFLCLFISTD